MTTLDLVLRASVGLLPVLCLLAALLWLDSYKLVSLRAILLVILLGAASAGLSWLANSFVLDRFDITLTSYSRYVAPLIEETFKGLIVLELIRRNRIGFLVDAVIFSFAVGAGFAMIENLYYLTLLPQAPLSVWIVRGFGTAIMHGGATAIFGILVLILSERSGRMGPRSLLPGLLLAALLHSAYNHFFLAPILATAGILVVLPPLLLWVFERSESSLGRWLEVGFDADTELIELINSGQLADSKVGRYLETLRTRFQGPVVADLLCYLRLRAELALRAKGILMMRESGFEPEIDQATRDKFAELDYLERSIGPTGMLAIKPFLHMSRRDLWELYQIGR
jgi:RsiW-degrading membrane proteinase PrsW (M82 family)